MEENPKIAFIHDWLVTFGGGEQILSSWLEIWPGSPVYTLVHDPDGPCRSITEDQEIHTSFIQRLPRSKVNHRAYLPFMPMAVEQFDLSGFDLIISCSHAVSHGILPQPDQLHINYICTPMRYAWHLYHQYIQGANLEKGVKSWLTKSILHYLRVWDAQTANRVDEYVAISSWVAQNVWRAYRRPASVIYPPVDTDAFQLQEEKDDFYVTVSRLVPYKKNDLIISAFNQMPEKKLIVIGDGPDLAKLQASAGKNIEFLGFQSFDTLRDCLQRARAFVYAAVEDFGIVPVEAMACGTPVIAYGKGGLLETVIDGMTGLFYQNQADNDLVEAINKFESGGVRYSPLEIRHHAAQFSKQRFQEEFSNYVSRTWNDYNQNDRRLAPNIVNLDSR
jgi:glycosyltransferase involved in cell wall biosynthesis